MATYELELPDLGEGVVEGEIVTWLVQPGDDLAEDQGIVELMTDKATVTVPSPVAGKVVALHGRVGEMAKVHAPLVTLELAGEAKVPAAATTGSAAPEAPAARAAAPAAARAEAPENGRKVLATPVTRRMAREHGIDLAAVAGSGPQGRVTKTDVLAALESNGGAPAGNVIALASARAPLPPPTPLATSAEDERIPLRGLRKKIAEKMVRSKYSAPHFTFVEEMDATELVALRKRINAQLSASGDTTKVSFLPFLCKALIATLREFPHLNAHFDEAKSELVVKHEYHLGIAAATEDGLTVPVVKNADRLSLRQLADEIARLGEGARSKRLGIDELTGSTFTITSLGQTGGLFATPIINHPEVAILGVHRMRKRPVVVENDQIVIREMMYLSLSFDHRVIDGSVGAEFTYALIRRLEHPELLFLELT